MITGRGRTDESKIEPRRFRPARHALLIRYTLLASLSFLLLAFSSTAVRTQSLAVDLYEMSRKLELRYYIAEHGKLPPGYILLGELSFHPNFLQGEFDTREVTVEYDRQTNAVVTYRVPAHRRFITVEERRGPYYYRIPRDVSAEDIDVELQSVEARAGSLWRDGLRRAWLGDVKYNLGRVADERPGGGLLSVDIPIPLPKQIERIIGRGDATNLTVSGREEITIGGESNWCANCPQTEGRPRQQKFPDLDMQQRLSVNLRGTIGEKINVEINHSSMGEGIQSTNKVRINYQGFDDEIIKLIEMGDTDLTVSGAQLVSYSGAARGLFGIKTIAQVGPLGLTVVASKEEGETASGSFTSSGGSSTRAVISDIDYIKRQYFYLECPGPDFDPLYEGGSFLKTYVPSGVEIEVFESLRKMEWDQTGGGEYSIKAYVDPENNGLSDNIQGGAAPYIGRFRKLDEQTDFVPIQIYDPAFSGIVYVGLRLSRPIDEDRALALRYRTNRYVFEGDSARVGSTITVGDYLDFTADTLQAELVCPIRDEFGPGTESPYPSTWNMMMRNVYSLGLAGANVDLAPEISIEDLSNRQNAHLEPTTDLPYLRIFGLDRYDQYGNLGSDERVDDLPGILDLDAGTIMFPWYQPFFPPREVTAQLLDYSESDPEESAALDSLDENLELSDIMYNEVITSLNRDKAHRFNIMVDARSSGQRTFQLAAFEIIENSEVVTMDGVKLRRGVDYDIEYTTGIVKLQGDILDEITPDSRVTIDYQHKPLLGGGKKTLLGVGADYYVSEHGRLAGVFLYNSVGAAKLNPRLGEEPGRMMAADINGSFNFSPRWMTSLVNLLPRVDTDNPSSLTFSGEVAMSMPNPNTKGEAFVDDMEGIEESDLIGLVRPSWYEASPPLDPLDPEVTLESLDSLSIDLAWYNPYGEKDSPTGFLVATNWDLNPRLDKREVSRVNSLLIRPWKTDESEWEPDDWTGLMAGFAGGGLDLTTAQYLEIWVNDFQVNELERGGRIHIDFGRIDEDFYQPELDRFDDEDKLPYGWNRELEDTGFDGEGCTYQFNNWDASMLVLQNINCRQLNGAYDSEDLNNNTRLDRTNAYYTLSFDLADTALIDVQRDFDKTKYAEYWQDKDENSAKAWRLYRLDISKAVLADPSGQIPRMDAVQHMRIWIDGLDRYRGSRGDILQIANVKFVGSRWLFDGIRDAVTDTLIADPPPTTEIAIGAINNKEEPELYRSPYRVLQEEGLETREQSLLLEFEDLEGGHSFQAVKRYIGQGQDFSQYRELQFFLQADEGAEGTGFYFQVAYDSLNYYEIEVPVNAANSGRWQLVTISLIELTNLKLRGEDYVEETIGDAVDPARFYTARLLGNPSLFQVRALYTGVRNLTAGAKSGRVFFNDIRLGRVRTDIDHAERTSFGADFGGVLNISGSWQRTGSEFRSLNQTRGSGSVNSAVSFNGKTKIDHFVPTLGFDLPVSAKYSSSKGLPKYIPKSDVEIISEAVRDSLRTVNNNYSLNLSISRRGSSNFFMRNFFDNFKTSVNHSKRGIYSPSTRDTTWTTSWNASYQIYFRQKRTLTLFRGIKWRWWLSNFNINSAGSNKLHKTYTLSGAEFKQRPVTRDIGWNTNLSTLYEPFESIKIDFSMREQRNAGIYNEFQGIPIGVQTSFSHNLKLRYEPSGGFYPIRKFHPRYEFGSRYNEDLRPSIRQGNDPFGTRNVNAQRDMSMTLDLDVGGFLVDFGEWVGLFGEDEITAAGYARAGSQDRMSSTERFQQMLRDQQKSKSDDRPKDTRVALPGVTPTTPGEPAPQQPPAQPGGTEEQEEKPGAYQDLAIKRRPGAPGQQPGEAPADTAAVEEAAVDTTVAPPVDYLLLPKRIIQLIAKFDPVKTNIRMNHNSNYQRLHERAGILYQLGLSDEAGVPGKSGRTERDPERASDNLIIDFHSGMRISSNLDLDIKANINKRIDDYGGRETKADRITWPSVNFSWNGMEKSRMLNNYVKSADLRVGFDRKHDTNIRGEELSYSITPQWNLTWKNDLTTNLSVAYKRTTSIENKQELWSQSWSVNVSARYKFEGSKGLSLPLPFLSSKKLKFKSELITNVDVGYSSTSRYNMPSAGTLSISPKATYRFSEKIRGSLVLNYKRSGGGLLGYVYHTVGMHVTAEFTF